MILFNMILIMLSLFTYLSEVKDFRRKQGQRISLGAFLEMVTLAGLSGYFGINSIARFIKNNETFFVQRYQLQHGVPSLATVFNILKDLPYEELNNALRKWMEQYVETRSDLWIAIDGKALCSTVTDKHGKKQNYKSIVSMFSKEKGIVLSAKSIEKKKEQEGGAARDLIRVFEGKGMTFTMDALHCQKKRLKPSWSQEMTM